MAISEVVIPFASGAITSTTASCSLCCANTSCTMAVCLPPATAFSRSARRVTNWCPALTSSGPRAASCASGSRTPYKMPALLPISRISTSSDATARGTPKCAARFTSGNSAMDNSTAASAGTAMVRLKMITALISTITQLRTSRVMRS
jgi:hypothetical protein